MNRRSDSRSFRRDSRAPRISPARASSPPKRSDHRRPAVTSAEGAVLSLLSDVLIGDSEWTIAEVQRLIALRDLADLGRWRAAGLDDEGASAP
jgi:hypothetical protein